MSLRKTTERNIWEMMRQRCLNPKYNQFHDYGGRGVTICKRWLKFENFLMDMGLRPIGKTLERKNNNRGYSKANCIWATHTEQMRNRRNTRLLMHRGRTQSLPAWAEELGLNYQTLYVRIYQYGWPVQKALTTKLDVIRSQNSRQHRYKKV